MLKSSWVVSYVNIELETNILEISFSIVGVDVSF